jgi:hypothetical protein
VALKLPFRSSCPHWPDLADLGHLLNGLVVHVGAAGVVDPTDLMLVILDKLTYMNARNQFSPKGRFAPPQTTRKPHASWVVPGLSLLDAACRRGPNALRSGILP